MWSRGRILSRAVAPSRDLQASRGAACHVGRAPEQGQPGRGGQPGAGDGADPSAARRPQDRCVRASPAQMPARGNGNFLRYYDLSQLPCQISQVSELRFRSLSPPLPVIPVLDSDRSIRRVKLLQTGFLLVQIGSDAFVLAAPPACSRARGDLRPGCAMCRERRELRCHAQVHTHAFLALFGLLEKQVMLMLMLKLIYCERRILLFR